MPVREKALALVAGLPPKDWQAEMQAIFAFVRDRIRYVRDVAGVETVATPVKTLELGQGDCDDKTTLLAALLGTIGCETRFVALGFAPGHYSHVILEAQCNGEWVPLDPTEPVGIGWRPAGALMTMREPVK